MTIIKLYKHNFSYFIAMSMVIILFDLAILQSILYREHEQILTLGITLDFVVVLPLLLYFFIYRRLNKKIVSILPFVLVGYIAVVLLVPDPGQKTLEIVKYMLIPMELLFLSYGMYRIYQTIKNDKQHLSENSHPIETLRRSLEATFIPSKIASLFVHDVSIFYYAIFAWRKKPYIRDGSSAYSYHKNSSWLITVLMVSKIMLIEGIGAHLLLMQWSHPVAWILSIGNIYIMILLLADYRAMCLNPLLVTEHEIRIQYGLQMSLYLDRSYIESVSMIKYEKLSKSECKTSVIPLVVEPNVCIRLKDHVTVMGLFGKSKRVDHIYLFLDKPHEFQMECQEL
ncbi:hypothetical protein BVG16_13225 [Paenibacillus selenitireducens]|uniref:Beta-carotene 15,15'-monooxygenase n=1 Tax=Paenibacillus selenitireducens TaxID=1324314 RepID=A0A1T2XCK5_9BACL|nr:hypothetical protein [Paenibacillus selenitireducens]OPA77416.1 hypothetical protein BVG16_13225 [Paenibacillus selenitireducens]